MPTHGKPDLSAILSNHQDWLRLIQTKQNPLTEKECSLRGDLSGLEIKEYNFSYLDLSYMTLENTYFKGCIFTKTALKGVWALNAYFESCLMQEVSFCNAYGKGIDFTGSSLKLSDLSHSFLMNADFTDVDLSGVKAVGSFFQGAILGEAILSWDIDVKFSRFDLEDWKRIERLTSFWG